MNLLIMINKQIEAFQVLILARFICLLCALIEVALSLCFVFEINRLLFGFGCQLSNGMQPFMFVQLTLDLFLSFSDKMTQYPIQSAETVMISQIYEPLISDHDTAHSLLICVFCG